jgi:hypothetical protein
VFEAWPRTRTKSADMHGVIIHAPVRVNDLLIEFLDSLENGEAKRAARGS